MSEKTHADLAIEVEKDYRMYAKEVTDKLLRNVQKKPIAALDASGRIAQLPPEKGLWKDE